MTDTIQSFAEQNECAGVFYEPRILFDEINYTTSTNARQFGNPDIFRNGERFPMRITHICMAILDSDTVASPANTPANGDERMIQRYSLRIRAHDDFYMNQNFVLAPLWHNKAQPSNDVISRSTSTWKFLHPFVMGQRDTLEVRVQLEDAPASARTVGVSFQGYGLYSRRPKHLSAEADITTTDVTTLDTDRYRTDGTEPIVITQATVSCSAPQSAADPTGDIRQARVAIAQRGSGTNNWWQLGPVSATSPQLCPAVLLGVETGRCVVHELPADPNGNRGWLWVPGEGVSIETEAVTTGRTESLGVAMLGYLIGQ